MKVNKFSLLETIKINLLTHLDVIFLWIHFIMCLNYLFLLHFMIQKDLFLFTCSRVFHYRYFLFMMKKACHRCISKAWSLVTVQAVQVAINLKIREVRVNIVDGGRSFWDTVMTQFRTLIESSPDVAIDRSLISRLRISDALAYAIVPLASSSDTRKSGNLRKQNNCGRGFFKRGCVTSKLCRFSCTSPAPVQVIWKRVPRGDTWAKVLFCR